MQKFVILFFCLASMNCSKTEMASDVNVQNNSNKVTPVAPITESTRFLKPVIPKIKLNSRQQKYLNESLPPKVREILEKAEKFEVLAEIRRQNEFDGEGNTFEPNRILDVNAEKDKKDILETFYYDASREDSPAVCYEPHHSIRAIYQSKAVEIEICFSCSRFIVKSEFGKFDGTIVRENRKSEDFFNRIIELKSIEIENH